MAFLFILSACASPKPVRKVASNPGPSIYDSSKSQVQIYPAVSLDGKIWYYFYVEVKNTSGRHMYLDPAEIDVKTRKGKKIPFKIEQVLGGRFYLTLEKTPEISSSELDVFVKGRPLKEQFKLHIRYPDKMNSRITVVKKDSNKTTFRLYLADKDKRPVELPEKPEIILEGMADIEDLKHVSEGTWEFSLIYPNENQIFYFSVRAMGVYLSNLYRYQHVEK